ncbi:unnamed protein product [Rotaria sp. Silwood2]|nr:unnamed protein product [Rotaria sp. Silwood2]CAF4539207.1 unnamed protein product [Rotaria sp. Silwood2]
MLNSAVNSRWEQSGVTIAGNYEWGDNTNRLQLPEGLFVNDDQTMAIADFGNHRIIQWKVGDKVGRVVAGGMNKDNPLGQLKWPTDVLTDKETDSLIICDQGNRRVVRLLRRSEISQIEILIDNITCRGLAMDDQKYLYISDYKNHEVRRYQIGNKTGTIVAGGNGKGAGLNQLNFPTYLFVDRQHNVYVSDKDNHRVIKWSTGAKEGIIVAGGQGEGNAPRQLSNPRGIFVDASGNLYVADSMNHRVMCYRHGAKDGVAIVGGNYQGSEANQFNELGGLSFDFHGNLYVVDHYNNRVQRFSLK